MTYIYSQVNRLEEPHSYMYTAYQGHEFLSSYFSSRLNSIHSLAVFNHNDGALDSIFLSHTFSLLEHKFNNVSSESVSKIKELLKIESSVISDFPNNVTNSEISGLANNLVKFTISEVVKTQDLLYALISSILVSDTKAECKTWLDRLVQRYEVTKKIYELYQPGFRKGIDSSANIHLYWLLALALGLYYLKYNEIKYLSALLKICDLLCSLPKEIFENKVSQFGLKLVLLIEIYSIYLLAEQKGISFESN